LNIELKNRNVSFYTATNLVVAAMVGTGVFTSLGYQLVSIQSTFSILALWVIGGIIAFFGALIYSELGLALPRSGGEYHLLSKIIHPSIGFSAGIISSIVAFSAPAVICAMACESYIEAVFPTLEFYPIGAIVIVLFHFLHMSSVKYGAIFQNSSTTIKIILIFVFCFFGILTDNYQPIRLIPTKEDILSIISPNFAVGLVWVSYAYAGWSSSIYISNEIKDPSKNLPRSMLYGTILVTILYVLLNFTFLLTTPIEEMKGKIEIGYISGEYIFGAIGSKVMGVGITILLLSTMSSLIFIGPRVSQIIGEDHKFIKFLAEKDQNAIPINAYWFHLIISIFFIMTSSFQTVVLYSGISMILMTILTSISLFILRLKKPNINRPYKVWGFPYTPLIFLIVNIWTFIFTFLEFPLESFVGIGIVLFSILLFWVGNKVSHKR
jgi:basic amino acid/polyamine antiporter, APA family